ncbi:aminoglycoside phosphotransferase family protein [Profundibacterium mesophilum]|uniref:Aminoglycoside phosphotransferase n=1 Tax=Profundibacterium mesophilum KAUST100406-0324 TaxID=1037889 RepID=A0A921TB51_9RHOB|nr:phosphotransferase [Profundibacterium mesophilum]KAF0674880.1 Aminoglycoside phosphotransferase [Profundibacterium mesophilum KAUST100406-0324]
MSLRSADETDAARRAFLADHAPGAIRVTPLASDASARRYFRLEEEGLLLLQDDDGAPTLARFIEIAAHLRQLGLSAPALRACDVTAGLALIEDFGDGTYTRLLAQGRDEAMLYGLAVDALAHLHERPEATAISVPTFDLPRMMEELTLFTDWFVPRLRPAVAHEAFRRDFLDIARGVLAPVGGLHGTLILRDFHVDNLMLLEERHGVAACGLLDFQDAVIGGGAYDLVSLLQDARRDLASGLEERMLARYLAARPALDAPTFMRHYHLYGLQRHLRIAGVFVRLAERDGKPHYLAFMPRVLRQVQQALAASRQEELQALLSRSLGAWTEWPAQG